ncbi:DUF6888 family protein [Microcoleus vaginatus]
MGNSLFRFDPQSHEVYIFAGDELQIIVFLYENWSFVDEAMRQKFE